MENKINARIIIEKYNNGTISIDFSGSLDDFSDITNVLIENKDNSNVKVLIAKMASIVNCFMKNTTKNTSKQISIQ